MPLLDGRLLCEAGVVQLEIASEKRTGMTSVKCKDCGKALHLSDALPMADDDGNNTGYLCEGCENQLAEDVALLARCAAKAQRRKQGTAGGGTTGK